MPDVVSGPAYVLRALAAAEIAESCTERAIRERFFALAGDWLVEAARTYADEGCGPDAIRLTIVRPEV